MADELAAKAPAVAETVCSAAADAGNEPVAKTDDENKVRDALVGRTEEGEKKTDLSKEQQDNKESAASAPPEEAAANIDDSDKPVEETAKPADQPDTEMKDADELNSDEAAVSPPSTKPAVKDRRKSGGPAASSAKKLNKKGSKAQLMNIHAQPGDFFFVRLKGYPKWPVIVADEEMLPKELLRTRPVSAIRQDGTYREDFADGGKRAGERSFAVMYLYTNEFGWVPSKDLSPLDPETVLEGVNLEKMRKDLAAAYETAANNAPLQTFKDMLQEFQDETVQREEEEKAKAAAKAATPAKKKKPTDCDEDAAMEDVDDAADWKKSAKKRKAEDNIETSQRSDSVKKTKIKLTTSTPKTANGASSRSTKSEAKPKTSKSKTQENAENKSGRANTPKEPEPELSAAEKLFRKEKEVLFLRHKLQKGLITRDQPPKEEDMKSMSDFVGKLEADWNLEVAVIRNTKINKVLKAILKLDFIPKEAEYRFKERSQALLDKWNKILASDANPAPAAATNGLNGTKDAPKDDKGEQETPETNANGVKEHQEEDKAEPVEQKEKPAEEDDVSQTAEA